MSKAKSNEVSHLTLSYGAAHKIGFFVGSIITVLITLSKAFLLPHDIHTWQNYHFALAGLIAGGLAYSAPTVQAFGFSMMPAEKIGKKWYNAFQWRTVKSWGVVILLEGMAVCLPLQQLLGHKFWIGLTVTLLSSITLAAINGYNVATMAVNRFVLPAERKAWAQLKKDKNDARLALARQRHVSNFARKSQSVTV